MQEVEPHQHIYATQGSIAAGGNVEINADAVLMHASRFHDYQKRFDLHSCDPRCMHCDHCGLRGQPPKTDNCLYCGNDVGKVRRVHDAARARKRRVDQVMADVRRFVCYGASLLALVALLQLRGNWHDENILWLGISVLLLTAMLGELLTYAWISVEVWLQYDLPRLLRRAFHLYTR